MNELRELDAKILALISPDVEIVKGWSHTMDTDYNYSENSTRFFVVSDKQEQATIAIEAGLTVVEDYLYRTSERALYSVPTFSSSADGSGWLMREMERRGFSWQGKGSRSECSFSFTRVNQSSKTEYEAKARAALEALQCTVSQTK